jgi:DNA polymerase (family 10)
LRRQPAVERAEIGGSLRRYKETIGDIDIMVASDDPKAVMDAFLGEPSVSRVKSRGETKASVELVDGMAVQVWVHPPDRFGSALQYATGSQSHNVRLRELALKQGLSLSEHGYKKEGGSEIVCRAEEDVYGHLGLPWIAPELREDRGEIQAAQAGELPDLIELSDLKGDLQSHSDWSDGSCTLLEMAQGAQAAGLEYLLMTDHSRSLGVANGLSIERVAAQRTAIDEVQAEMGDSFRLLAGIETEILADGDLDYPDDVLSQFDVVLASLHTSLRQDGSRITQRLLSAINNPHVDIIGHPTGRLVGSRDPADLDMEAVFKAAAERKVILEINANPERLDLKDVHARRAVEVGVMLSISSDAHHPDHFGLLRYGIGTARRAWVTAEQVINTRPVGAFLEWIADRGK